MTVNGFDLRRLFVAIDAERQLRGLSWAALAREVGVSAPTIRRFGVADDAEADGVLFLIRWLGAIPEDYVTDNSVPGVRLNDSGDGNVRVDMELVAKAVAASSAGTGARAKAGANGRTRTTIQRLVEAAQRSGQPVAALTRLTDI